MAGSTALDIEGGDDRHHWRQYVERGELESCRLDGCIAQLRVGIGIQLGVFISQETV